MVSDTGTGVVTAPERGAEGENVVQPLAGLRVIELATGVAGGYAGKLLADFGADVVKLEPPGGDPVRAAGPFPDDVADPEQGALHLHLGTNKRSAVCNLGTGRGATCSGRSWPAPTWCSSPSPPGTWPASVSATRRSSACAPGSCSRR
ncbi:MAG: hypothetical protein GEV08_16730 [Acidimicrobiia bacterium]|nr:hypothetical protein [Acidimicrobiia bacterium]